MDLSKILSIAGKPGLFQMVSQTKNGMLVESLIDGKRMPAFSHERISSLEEISVFTDTEDVPLKNIFRTMFSITNQGQALSHKSSSTELLAFFSTVLPTYDREKVYGSDIKKMIQWYNLLQSKGLIDLVEEAKASDDNAEKREEVSK